MTPEDENQIGENQETAENLSSPVFETIRRIAVSELGHIYALTYSEVMAKAQEIAERESIANPLVVICVQDDNMQDFAFKLDEEEMSRMQEEYEDDEEHATPVIFLVDGNEHPF